MRLTVGGALSRHNLEPIVDRFFGRDADLAAIDERVRSAPIVTIAGPPGVGKTRVAREYAWRTLDARDAWFVSLAQARDEASAESAILSALGSQDTVTDSREAVLAAMRAKGTALVVFDNVEHLDLRNLLTAFVRDPERASMLLCTSRRVLGVLGEAVWTLGPITASSDALALLLDRVQRSYPTYAPSADEVAAAGLLVDRLDRLPLAIELVAPQLHTVSASDVLKSRRWNVAAGDTLRAALENSLVSLDANARRAFEEATVFRGGFTLEAAEQVLSAKTDAERDIRALLDGSLLFATGRSTRRFRMLEVIRELAAVSSALGEVTQRHEHYYLEHCDGLAHAMRAGKDGAREALEAEIENLSAIHAHALTSGSADVALRVAAIVEGAAPFPMRSALIDAAIALPNASAVPLAHAHLGRAALRRMQGDWLGSRADAETARAIGAGAGAKAVEGLAHVDLGAISKHQGDYVAAREHYEHGLTLLRSVADRVGEADALGFLAMSRLRRMGLPLVAKDGGYCLAEDVQVVM